MAAKYIYQNGFLLLLFNFISTAALEKRFSDLKRCADEECSMLLVRGKALDDFRGPDCRFLSFKKSETIYVYYKLAGRRADMWAGSVGSNFGYFPKDLLAINHIYTEKEYEVPAEETDFVCFETGFDKFQSYDIDQLLGFLREGSKEPSNITSSRVPESIQTDAKPLEQEIPQDSSVAPDEKNISSFETEMETELTPMETQVTSDTPVVDNESEQLTLQEPVDNVMVEVNETKDHESLQQDVKEDNFQSKHIKEPEPQVSPSENAQIPDLKTTYGNTFDAVVTEETPTAKTTPQDDIRDEQSLESQILTEDDTKSVDLVEEKLDDNPEESMWSSLGDAVFSVVTGGEKPIHDTDESSDEDEDDDEEDVVPPPKTFDEIRADKQPLDIKFTQPVDTPKIISKPAVEQEMQGESLKNVDDKEQAREPEKLIFEEEVVGPEEIQTGMVAIQQNDDVQREDQIQQDNTSQTQENANFQGQNVQMQNKTSVDEEEMATEPDITDAIEKIQESSDIVKQENLDGNATKSDVATDSTLPIEEEVLSDLNIVKHDQESISEEVLFEQMQENVDSISHPDLSIKEEPTYENIEEIEPDLKDEEELLEDENALSSFQTDTVEDAQSIEMPNVPQIPMPEPEKGEDVQLTPTDPHTDTKSLETVPPVSASVGQLPPADHHTDTHSVETVPPVSTTVGQLPPADHHTDTDSAEMVPSVSTSEPEPEPEPVYSDDVMRLSILRDHLSEEKMARCQKYLGLKNLFKLEAMFEDLQMELQATRQSQTGTIQEIENSLERILETSENAILDEVEKILDSRESKYSNDQHVGSNIDEETEILDDFQELAFSLRHKYSTASDSAPLAEVVSDDEGVPQDLTIKEDIPVMDEETDSENSTVEDHDLKASYPQEQPTVTATEKPHGIILDQGRPAAPDVSMEEDTGHFNRNKDNQQSLDTTDEMPKAPQDTLQNPLDIVLGAEVDNSLSGGLEPMDPPPEIHEDEVGLFSTALVYVECITAMVKSKTTEWATVIISLLPDEWRPGETLLGCPWQAVVVTALVGILTFTLFFWRTVLAVKKREYLVDDRKLNKQIELLKKDKVEALAKITALQTQTELLKENQKESAETATTALKKMQALETRVTEAEMQNEEMAHEKNKYIQLLEEERISTKRNETRIEKLEKSNEKLQQSRKKIQETLAKTTVLLDEAKIREDARNAQQKSLEKNYTALKEENKSLKTTIKSWEDKHKELSEQIKVYQKSQKELEDSLVLKDHNIEVLSDLMSDLDACDLQKGDPKVANGELSIDKDKTMAIKNRIKQMMDVSRVQTTLTVVEEERDRFMSKLLAEEKTRKSLEEQHQELEHAIAALKSEKSLVENQYKTLQQKNEIIVEMYQQKESALQQRLTKEEMDRRSKESMLTEVGGKATEAEEQVKVLRQRINEMEEQMKKSEEMYKEQIKEQENKTHSNWINARNAERALNQEKLEASKLREKLAVLTSQLNEKRAPLFRPNPGQFPGARQGDSYGPSPVSGGAPSPPIMIEGPRRPPSAPVGRKIDPYGPRPPSDPHGRYAENKHMPGMEMGPRNSSPANMDAPGLGSFIASPIRDSPGPAVPGPAPGPGPHEPLLPPGPPGRLPPPGAYRPMRPGPYPYPPPGPQLPPHGPPLQANGHPGVPMGGEFGPRPSNGHAIQPRPGPGPMDPQVRPPPPHFRPPHPNFGPMPPPHIIRGPMGPHPPLHPDMRYPGPRASPPVDMPPGTLPPGVPPPGPLAHGIPPQGPLPHGVPPPGPLPHGVPPPGPLPHGIPPSGPLPHGVPPPGPLPHGVPAHPTHSGPYGQPPPPSLQNSGAHGNPRQDSPQGAGSPAGIEP